MGLNVPVYENWWPCRSLSLFVIHTHDAINFYWLNEVTIKIFHGLNPITQQWIHTECYKCSVAYIKLLSLSLFIYMIMCWTNNPSSHSKSYPWLLRLIYCNHNMLLYHNQNITIIQFVHLPVLADDDRTGSIWWDKRAHLNT